MIAQQMFLSTEGSLRAAPLAVHYPQFKQVEVPIGSRGITAWEGKLRPFPDDITAREVLRRLESNEPFDICAGTIATEKESLVRSRSHWAEPMLVSMEVDFTVIVLEYPGPEHPRAFAIQPQISRNPFPMHPHLLDGISIVYGKQQIPALCVYSGAQYQYTDEVPRIVEFLDQLTTYLARHLIWRRTRRLFEVSRGSVNEIHVPAPRELILDREPRLRTAPIASTGLVPTRFWEGYWPGTEAPQTSEAHLRTISPERECWCCRGKPYGECCRPHDLRRVSQNSGLRQ